MQNSGLKRTIGYAIIVCCLPFFCQTPDASDEDWFKQGVAHLVDNRPDAAIEAFTRVIELVPHDYEAYNNRGIAYTRRGESHLGELDFSRALKHNPQFYSAFLNRGLARQEQGAYASALLDYLEAHQLQPDRKRPRLLMAWVLATCPDSRLRDGALALQIAQTLSDHQQNSRLALLAAAHAADGNFTTAVALQKKHLDQMHIRGVDAGQAAAQQNALARFQSKRPFIKGAPASKTVPDSDARALMTALDQTMNTVIAPAERDKKVSKKHTANSPAGTDTLPEKPSHAPITIKVKRPKRFRVKKERHKKNPVHKPLPKKSPSLKKNRFSKKTRL